MSDEGHRKSTVKAYAVYARLIAVTVVPGLAIQPLLGLL